jgi:ATP/maltotriose-dependent transcriptional regulator MalT
MTALTHKAGLELVGESPLQKRSVRERLPRIGKIAQPRLHDAYNRSRLFRKLDEAREYSIVWITAPPGAGKSTLVTSYIDDHGFPALWYHMDQYDSDPGTFFCYLSLAIQEALPHEQIDLPELKQAHQTDTLAFMRQYLGELYHHLPAPFVLVFDDYQTLPQDSVIHKVLQEMVLLLPHGVNLLITSREEPPPVTCQSADEDNLR